MKQQHNTRKMSYKYGSFLIEYKPINPGVNGSIPDILNAFRPSSTLPCVARHIVIKFHIDLYTYT